MFNRLLEKLDGADFYMVISFLIFTIFFVGVAIYLLKSDKKHIKMLSELPLNNDDKN